MPAVKKDDPNFPRDAAGVQLPPTGAKKVEIDVSSLPPQPLLGFFTWITDLITSGVYDAKTVAELKRQAARAKKAGLPTEEIVRASYLAIGMTPETAALDHDEPVETPVQVHVRTPAIPAPTLHPEVEDVDGLVRLSASTAVTMLAQKLVEEVWRTHKKALVAMVTGDAVQQAVVEELKARLRRGFEDA